MHRYTTKYLFHVLQDLLAKGVLVSLLLSGQVFSELPADKNKEIPTQCSTGCVTFYGKLLGETPTGVPAYSNCDSDCVIFEPNHLNDVYTGIKWQCVEYARRWLLKEQGVVFGDVDIAADIWAIPQVTNPVNHQTQNFVSMVNGAHALPQKGDLIIYGKGYLGTGHVAVVVTINEKQQTIQVAEQNYKNTQWPADYAREIKYTNSDNRYWLLDHYLIGWKRVEQTEH